MKKTCNMDNSQPGGLTLRVGDDGRFSYLDSAGTSGWVNLGFRATIRGTVCAATPRKVERVGEDGFDLLLDYGPSPVEERVRIRRLRDPEALTVERVFRNTGRQPLAIDEVRTVSDGTDSAVLLRGLSGNGLRCVHVSNLREGRYRTGWSIGPYVCPLPRYARVIGDAEGHPFPALAVCDGGARHFLLEASLQYERFTPMWLLNAERDVVGDSSPDATGLSVGAAGGESIFAEYAAIARDPRKQPLLLEPGNEIVLSHLFYQILPDTDLEALHDGYLAVLGRRETLRGGTSPLLHDALYCTWNYGFMAAISEEILRGQCAFIAKNLPGVKHFLIDDGYQLASNTPTYDMGKFYPDPDANIDPVRFPNGMKAVADMIRSHGLMPSLWWSPAMGRLNRLVTEHPEWCCLDRNGESWSMDSGPHRKAALDFSVKEARDFVEFVLETIFVKWGFTGLKLDFCTYPFDSKDIVFRNGEAVRWWNWFLAAVAKFIPPGGIFQLCGGAPNGNPFLGRWCDNHRIGGDIGMGAWDEHLAISHSPLPMLHVPGRAAILMDVDSAGIRQDLTDDENLSRLNWCYITQGLMGIGGDLTKLSPRQVGWLRRITDGCDRGHKVRCPDRRAFFGTPLPNALVVDYPAGSRRAAEGVVTEIAYFNWDDEPCTIGYSLSRLGVTADVVLVDFWTGETVPTAGGQLVAALNRRASRVFQVRRTGADRA